MFDTLSPDSCFLRQTMFSFFLCCLDDKLNIFILHNFLVEAQSLPVLISQHATDLSKSSKHLELMSQFDLFFGN